MHEHVYRVIRFGGGAVYIANASNATRCIGHTDGHLQLGDTIITAAIQTHMRALDGFKNCRMFFIAKQSALLDVVGNQVFDWITAIDRVYSVTAAHFHTQFGPFVLASVLEKINQFIQSIRQDSWHL